MTSDGKNLEIERLRALAILSVFCFHTPIKYAIPVELRYSFTGVDLFFIISGYVVGTSIINRPVEPGLGGSIKFLKGFYTRRLFRIFPAAIFWGIVYIAAASIVPGKMSPVFGQGWPAAKEFLAYLSGFYNYVHLSGSLGSVMPHYWSLAVEEQFYLAAPLFLLVVRDHNRRIMWCAVVIALCAFVVRPLTPAAQVYTSTHTRLDSLLLGVLTALILQGERREQVAAALVDGSKAFFKWAVAVALGILFLLPGISGDSFRQNIGLNAYNILGGAAVFIAATARGCVFSAPFISTLLNYIGSRSYSLYLAHILAISISTAIRSYGFGYSLDVTSLPIHVLIMDFCLSALLATGMAEVSYRFIEKPFMRKAHSLVP
jgi:peptidoglycan/LPS O-acetylase OafA/YrhL